jgi:hypothetical protein
MLCFGHRTVAHMRPTVASGPAKRLCRSGRSATVSDPQRGSWCDVHVAARIVEYHLWSAGGLIANKIDETYRSRRMVCGSDGAACPRLTVCKDQIEE